MTTIEFLQEQIRAEKESRSYSVVTIVSTSGSVPRQSGKMLVYADGESFGTIGGSAIEYQAIQDAKECARQGVSKLMTYEVQQLISTKEKSGSVTVYIETNELRPLLVVCGGGHVGCAVLKQARFLGFETWLIDTRSAELIKESVDAADQYIQVEDYRSGIERLCVVRPCYAVLCGSSHEMDYQALGGMLKKNTKYLGMLGSKKKIATIYERLRGEGFSEEELAQVHSPIGLSIGAKTPEELSISILAEILQVKSAQ